MGLTLGLPAYDIPVQTIYASILALAVYVVDHPKILKPKTIQKFSLSTDYVEIDSEKLKSRVEEQLGHAVSAIRVRSVTTSPATMKIDVEA